jgi:hypothetical protein
MDRNKVAKVGAIVMILSLLLTIFIGAMSVKASTLDNRLAALQAGASTPASTAPNSPASSPAPSSTISSDQLGPNADLDGDGIPNNQDSDIDGDGIVNGLDPDIDGDGIPNGEDKNPASTNTVDSSAPGQFALDRAWQWSGAVAVLAVLGWLVALPYLRRRQGTSSKSVGARGRQK